ncbi:hypothetical protein A4X13_0g7853, partial [Tilletia indica]
MVRTFSNVTTAFKSVKMETASAPTSHLEFAIQVIAMSDEEDEWEPLEASQGGRIRSSTFEGAPDEIGWSDDEVLVEGGQPGRAVRRRVGIPWRSQCLIDLFEVLDKKRTRQPDKPILPATHCGGEPDHATILCSHGRILLTHQDRDGTTRINGQPLNRDQRHLLRHGDQIELGYYEPMDDEYSFTLLLRVEVSSSPPPLSSTRARFPSPDQFLPTTRSVLHASLALQDAMTQLSEALAKTRKQLQDALDREAAH